MQRTLAGVELVLHLGVGTAGLVLGWWLVVDQEPGPDCWDQSANKNQIKC